MCQSNCTGCYSVSVPECTETLTLAAGLSATTDYIVCIYKHGVLRQYNLEVTSDGDGDLAIDLTDDIYPSGLFNSGAGMFKLFVVEDISDVNNTLLTFDSKEYECVNMEFVSCDPDTTTFTIQ